MSLSTFNIVSLALNVLKNYFQINCRRRGVFSFGLSNPHWAPAALWKALSNPPLPSSPPSFPSLCTLVPPDLHLPSFPLPLLNHGLTLSALSPSAILSLFLPLLSSLLPLAPPPLSPPLLSPPLLSLSPSTLSLPFCSLLRVQGISQSQWGFKELPNRDFDVVLFLFSACVLNNGAGMSYH